MSKRLGVLGGMFDPVHNGHIEAARFAIRTLELESLQLVPCNIPNHRELAACGPADRLAMLQLAVAGESGISINPVELQRDQVSYTVDTLLALRDSGSNDHVVFVLGTDAFNSLTLWHRWQELFELCHLLVLGRDAAKIASATAAAVELDKRRVQSARELFAFAHGKIYLAEDFRVNLSSTKVREAIKKKQDLSALLNADVIEYINQRNLYSIGS